MGTQPALKALSASLAASAIPRSSVADAPVRQSPQTRLEVLPHFNEVFTDAAVTTQRDIEEAFRLRYQVYCLDRGFESADACPEGLEQDRFDDISLHCLLRHRTTDTPLGTVRLVQPPATPTWIAHLPLVEYAPEESIGKIMQLPVGRTAEVSRFAIARSAREVLRGANRASRSSLDGLSRESTLGEQLLPYMSLGLIRGLIRLSMQYGITHWCLAAEPSLLRRLRNYGLHFHNSGPLVEHRGLRQVCYAKLSELLERAEAERPQFWNILTESGNLLASGQKMQAA